VEEKRNIAPEAREAFGEFKEEIGSELGIEDSDLKGKKPNMYSMMGDIFRDRGSVLTSHYEKKK